MWVDPKRGAKATQIALPADGVRHMETLQTASLEQTMVAQTPNHRYLEHETSEQHDCKRNRILEKDFVEHFPVENSRRGSWGARSVRIRWNGDIKWGASLAALGPG